MDWCEAGIYRFGMVDGCRLPSDVSDCGILEDAYCILKLLEVSITDCSLLMIVATTVYLFIDPI